MDEKKQIEEQQEGAAALECQHHDTSRETLAKCCAIVEMLNKPLHVPAWKIGAYLFLFWGAACVAGKLARGSFWWEQDFSRIEAVQSELESLRSDNIVLTERMENWFNNEKRDGIVGQ